MPSVPMHCVPSAFHVYQTCRRKLLLYWAMKIENTQPTLLRTKKKWFYKVVDRCITSSPSVPGQKGQHNTQRELDSSWKGNKIQEMRWLRRQESVRKVVLWKSWASVLHSKVWWTVRQQACAGQTIRWHSIKIQFNFTFPIFVLAH